MQPWCDVLFLVPRWDFLWKKSVSWDQLRVEKTGLSKNKVRYLTSCGWNVRVPCPSVMYLLAKHYCRNSFNGLRLISLTYVRRATKYGTSPPPTNELQIDLSPIASFEVCFFLLIHEILIKELGSYGMGKKNKLYRSSIEIVNCILYLSAWPCWNQANFSTEVS